MEEVFAKEAMLGVVGVPDNRYSSSKMLAVVERAMAVNG